MEGTKRGKMLRERLLDGLAIAVGGALFGCGISVFTEPNGIAMGGATGVALMLRQLLGLPMGLTVLLLNIPLFLGSLRLFGRSFLIKTAVATAATAILIDLTGFLPVFTEDKLLAAICGGILSGAGLGLIYLRGMATGGSDLLARILAVPFPYINYGRLILGIDTAVVLLAALVFRDFWTVLYSAISIYLESVVVDALLSGVDRAKVVQIITRHPEEMKRCILDRLRRGVTVLPARGGWSEADMAMLVTVVRKYELFRLKALIRAADPDAFVIVGDANEVLGEGFKNEGG